ncbi:MAG TPA: hypothetical protein VK625_13780 [Flavitalea sp.]|nr:hypothetical protein [Flavitalea sp.]
MSAQTYGLHFASRETIPEKRTSLDLTPGKPLCFKETFSIDFDIHFTPGQARYSGYIFRLINKSSENIDLLFDNRDTLFKIVYKGSFTNLRFKSAGRFFSWNKIRISYSTSLGLSLHVNGALIGSQQVKLRDQCIKIFFGANQYQGFRNSDIPPMDLKNVRVSDKYIYYYWPLDKISGTSFFDSSGSLEAKVINPVWIAPLHSNWSKKLSFHVKGNASISFDPVTEQLFAIGNDSLYTYSVSEDKQTAQVSDYGKKLPRGNQSLFFGKEKKILNFYPDNKSLSEYDVVGKKSNSSLAGNGQLTAFWHATKFISTVDSSLYVVGGYGYNKYKNTILRYHLYRHTWDSIKPTGDFFAPRYLAAAGVNKTGDTAFIIGGYGSESGDQMLSPGYFYDLYSFDIRHRKFTKSYTLNVPAEHFVFGNSLIVNDSSRTYQALVYPKDKFNASLQLIKGSLDKPEYEFLASSFPYSFFDSKSYADLFLCKNKGVLLAVTLFRIDDSKGGGYEDVSNLAPDQLAKLADATIVNVYTIADPPNASSPPAVVPGNRQEKKQSYKTTAITILGLIVTGLIFFLLFRRKNKAVTQKTKESNLPIEIVLPAGVKKVEVANSPPFREASLPVQGAHVEPMHVYGGPATFNKEDSPGAKILLFGDFIVLDKEGNDLTKAFTPLLKELFLMILVYTLRFGKGVSLDKLNENFWSGKVAHESKNNRAVNIAKLKTVLDKIGHCTIKKEGARWIFAFDSDKVYIDFAEYLKINAAQQENKLNRLLGIATKGGFLQNESYYWLDDIKSEISNKLIDSLIQAAHELNINESGETRVQIANTIFLFDELNEQALVLKCRAQISLGRHALAKITYERFVTKYREIYGQDFKLAFQDIINNSLLF